MNDNLYEKIKNNISKYLDFDVNDLLENTIDFDDAYIFGGAVRDSISGDKINDVDILCLNETYVKFIKIIENNGYIKTDKLVSKNIDNVYEKIKVIFQPVTYMKIVNNKLRLIQLIKPNTKGDIITMKNDLKNLLTQVDFSNCGVYIDKKGLHESVKGSILQCELKIFTYLGDKQLFQTARSIERKNKFLDRGWTYCKNILSNENYKLKLKLNNINNKKYYKKSTQYLYNKNYNYFKMIFTEYFSGKEYIFDVLKNDNNF